MSIPRVTILTALLLAALGPAQIMASPAPAAPAKKFLPTLLVPPRTGANIPAVWDSLARIEYSNQWAVSESLAVVLVKRLESASPTDSLALAHALLYESNGLIKRRIFADGSGFAALE